MPYNLKQHGFGVRVDKVNQWKKKNKTEPKSRPMYIYGHLIYAKVILLSSGETIFSKNGASYNTYP